MRCCDKRVSTNIPNVFWKTKYKQIHQIHQQVSFALCRNQTKGKKITAKTLLNTQTRQEIVKYVMAIKYLKMYVQAHLTLNPKEKNSWQ